MLLKICKRICRDEQMNYVTNLHSVHFYEALVQFHSDKAKATVAKTKAGQEFWVRGQDQDVAPLLKMMKIRHEKS